MNFISGKQARRALRQGDHGFLAWVSAAEEKPTLDLRQIIDSKSGSSQEEQEELLALLHEYSDVLTSELPSRLPLKRSVNHNIDLVPGASPPSRPPYRLSKPMLDELQVQLTGLLDKGFIEPSKSPYGAPVFFVKKSDGSFRLVCDWRELNKITLKNEACLPNINTCLTLFRGASISRSWTFVPVTIRSVSVRRMYPKRRSTRHWGIFSLLSWALDYVMPQPPSRP